MRLFYMGFILLLLLTACRPTPAAPPPVMATTAAVTTEPTSAGPAVTQPAAPAATEVRVPIAAPSDNIPYTPGAGLPPGLLYTLGAGNGLGQIDAAGQPQPIWSGYQTVLAPDGRRALFSNAYEGDIWLADLVNGASVNLTHSEDVNEIGYQWWPGNPDVILFYYKRMNVEGISNGSLAMLRADGSGFQVIDTTESALGQAAPAPDGRTIALDQGGQPVLYTLESGLQPLHLADFGIQAAGAINPAWSPDGRRLAWVLTGEGQYSVAVLDLETRQGLQMHPFSTVGGGLQPTLAYSPDGAWLALSSFGEAGKAAPVIWALRSDGSQEVAVGNGVGPVWSPDGRFLVFTHTPPGAGSYLEDQVLLAAVGDWQPLPLALEPGARAVGWMRVTP